ncbi:hypothetical protein MPY17_13940 [Rhodococcus opacus]|uniref:hypothetical protein n=1 Tax=Rhodococcus opacus TaxID=37919 RepID=UPI001FF4FB31|nr:hypothetical protein [Rhodococcus opacus]UOT06770.1 hypothetical protein MPY17_13940 [Rhodococcus opacus]
MDTGTEMLDGDALDVREIVSDTAASDGFELFDATELEQVWPRDPITINAIQQTSAVRFSNFSCTGGVETAFTIPIQAYAWSTRLHSYNAAGGLIAKSGIITWNRSFYPGSIIRARFSGPFIRGTGQIRGFYWYGEPSTGNGTIYWNLKNVSC